MNPSNLKINMGAEVTNFLAAVPANSQSCNLATIASKDIFQEEQNKIDFGNIGKGPSNLSITKKKIDCVLSNLGTLHSAPDAMSIQVNNSCSQIHTLSERFAKNTLSYSEEKNKTQQNLKSLNANIASNELQFNEFSYAPPESNVESSLNSSLDNFLEKNTDTLLYYHTIGNMADARIIAGTINTVPSLVAKGAEKTCNSHPVLRKTCGKIGNVYEKTSQFIKEKTPHTVKEQLGKIHDSYQDSVQQAIVNNQKIGISEKQTKQYFEDTLDIGSVALPTPPLTKTLSNLAKVGSRLNYSRTYLQSKKNFAQAPKEFNGKLGADLVVVNYHSDVPIGKGRSLAWAMPAHQANQLGTLEDVLEHAALLRKFGDRTHVTVARIPSGTQVKFLHGKSAMQQVLEPLEIRKGGAIQYRFYDFDPKWIVETRALPGLKSQKVDRSPFFIKSYVQYKPLYQGKEDGK